MIQIITLTTITAVELAAEDTQNTNVSISPEEWLDWLHAEHSPIRAFLLRIKIHDVPYYVSTHLVRHKIGVEHFVRSQRPDNYNPVNYDRRRARQDMPVNHTMIVNPQALINISRRRLCERADETTRWYWNRVKKTIAAHGNEYVKAIAQMMLPDCEYRGGICHEMDSCGKYPRWR